MQHEIHRLPFSDAVALVAAHARSQKPLAGSTRVITIDGPAGAGKSTMAKYLAPLLSSNGIDAPIVHMDDLYRGWNDALTPRLAATLQDQILKPISLEKSGGYRRWDWHQNQLGESVTIARHDFLILEGVGASQRVVRPFATTMVWIGIEASEGLARVLNRDGAIVADQDEFKEEMLAWQGAEILHFERENTFDTAHLRFDGGVFAMDTRQ
jgi:Cytidylate kinase